MAQHGNTIGGEPGQGMGGRSENRGSGAAPHEGGELGWAAARKAPTPAATWVDTAAARAAATWATR